MNIIRLEVGQMKSNCFLVSDDSQECIIIDPGDDAEYIISSIQKNDLTPKLIIATHGHFDHVMAALEIKLAFNIPFYIHKSDLFLLNNMRSSAMHFLNFDPGPPVEVDIFLENKEIIKLGNSNFEVIETPGHTPGSICLYSKTNKNIFVGDLIFSGGYVGRTDFSYSDESELKKSIARVSKLGSDISAHCGHGEIFLLSDS